MADVRNAGGDPTVVALGLVLGSLIETLVQEGRLSGAGAGELFDRAAAKAASMPGFFGEQEAARLETAIRALQQIVTRSGS